MKIPPPRRNIDVEEALRLRKQGLNAVQIARRLGFTVPAVRRAIRRAEGVLRPERSCRTVRHGQRLYSLWLSLRARCSKPGHALYARYGARGYSVTKEWGTFWPFYDWALASGYRPRRNLDVTGRSRTFSPRACRWISVRQRMRRDGYPGGRKAVWLITAFGETQSASVRR